MPNEGPVVAAMVSHYTVQWIRVGLGSFRDHFPREMVVVVDNNPERGEPGWNPLVDAERAWLRARPDILLIKNHSPDKRHGTGMDVALDWCRSNDAGLFLHIEPDCLISGTRWFEGLRDAIDAGAWMAGGHRKLYGPIHPTPSLWRVGEVADSFEIQPRGPDADHPRFRELVGIDWLVEAVRCDGGPSEWWRDHWDTAQKAWFRAALHGRAAFVAELPDFRHFWGATNAHRHHPALSEDPRMVALLAESP